MNDDIPIVPVNVQPKNDAVGNDRETNCDKDVTFHVSSHKNPQEDWPWKKLKDLFLTYLIMFLIAKRFLTSNLKGSKVADDSELLQIIFHSRR